jgi:hypothetical protein
MKSERNRLSVVEGTWRARPYQQPHTLLFVVSSPSTATAVSVDQTAARNALAREARHLADAMESLCGQLLKTGALVAIRRFMQLHAQGNPDLDILDAAKTLRAYAGILSAISLTPQQTPAGPLNPTHPKLPCPRIESQVDG